MTTGKKVTIAAAFLLVVPVSIAWLAYLGPLKMTRAASAGDVQKIDRLRYLGVNPDRDGFLVGGALHCAAANGQTKAMAALTRIGARIDRIDGYGQTPLHVAVQHGQMDSIRWLLAHGANPVITNREGQTAVALAKSLANEQAEREIKSNQVPHAIAGKPGSA